MAEREDFPQQLSSVRLAAGALGAVGAVIAVILLIMSPDRFFHGYMFAYVFCLALTLGCLALTLITHVTRSSWGGAILRLVEAGAGNLWFMALLTLPILYTVWTRNSVIFPWADPAVIQANHHLHGRALYFSPAAFTVRIAVYFALWILWSFKLRRWSIQEDETLDPAVNQARVNWSAPGIVMFMLTATFAFTDLVMSLDPLWYSTIWGIWWAVCCGLAGSSFAVFMLSRLGGVKPYSDIVSPGLFRDLGNVLLTFTMFWAYISLSQWLIIYSGNLPEETTYYIQRGLGAETPLGAWWVLSVLIVFGQFFVPFLLLLSGRTKRTPAYLGALAAWLLLIRALDVLWTVLPFFRTAKVRPDAMTFAAAAAALVGIGGIWLFLWVSNLAKARLLPRHNMFVKEAVEQHAH